MIKRAAILVVAGVAAVQFVLVAAAGAEAKRVTLSGARFSPDEVSITVGDSVIWEHKSGSNTHTVTFEDGFDPYNDCTEGPDLFDSCMTEGDTVERRFLLAGSFRYYCRIHRASGMTGVVNVLGGAAPGATTSTTKATGSSGNAGSSSSSSSSSTATTEGAITTSTTRPTPSSIVVRSTTTTAGVAYQPAPKAAAPSFNPADEVIGSDDLESGDGESASGGASGGGDAGGSPGLLAGAAALVAVGGGALVWRLRPRRA